MSATIDLDWDCPSRGIFIALNDHAVHGRIQQTAVGFATFDVLNNHIGTFPDFIGAENALAHLSRKGSRGRTIRHTELVGAAFGSAALIAGMIAWSLLAVTTK